MRLDMSQQVRMEQRMALAPRMIQSMEILQLPLLALQERIEQEMLSNPMLELDEPQDEVGPEGSQQANEARDGIADAERSLLIKDDRDKKDDFERLGNTGDEYDDYWSRSSYVQPRRGGDDVDHKFEAMQNAPAPTQSLNEHLHDQWVFVECEPIIKQAGAVIIDFIDENGALAVDLPDSAERIKDEVTVEDLAEALELVQTLEPTGVGHRNLAECLLIQLRSAGVDRSLEILLVTNHLKDIEMNRYPAIAKKAGRTMDEIKKAVQVISRLDPRPGLQIGSHDSPCIFPDIIVEYIESTDDYVARLTDTNLPNLRINATYSGMLKQGKVPGEAKEFLQNGMRSARWLIESIEQRRTTLLRVVNHVLKTQRAFFDHGPLHLKPLPMVEVAAELEIHVGTVSRAVAGKYMQMPTGIYPLRSFFSGGTETDSGQSVSWDAVKAKLEEIVDNEDKNRPFNDDELVAELKHQGVTLARRTVAKYRNIMNIPPARRRKEFS